MEKITQTFVAVGPKNWALSESRLNQDLVWVPFDCLINYERLRSWKSRKPLPKFVQI
jgi:hypothetical protein